MDLRLPMAEAYHRERSHPPVGPLSSRPRCLSSGSVARRRRNFTSENRAGGFGDDLIGSPSEPVRHAISDRLARGRPAHPFGRSPVWQKGNRVVTVGVDTHKDAHAWRCARPPALLGTASFPHDARGYLDGRVDAPSGASRARRGVEGTGGYGAGLAARSTPRASACPRSRRPTAPSGAGAGRATGSTPSRRRARSREPAARRQSRCAEMGALGALEATSFGAVKARTAALNALPGGVVALPEEARARCAARAPRAGRACASMRPGAGSSPETLAKSPCARSPGGRACSTEAKAPEAEIDALTKALAPSTSRSSRRAHVAAGCCSPQAQHLAPALGGVVLHALQGEPRARLEVQADRHRLSRAGDRRQARRSTPWRSHPHGFCDSGGRSYVARRMSEGKTKDAIRCLKRYIARESLPRPRAGYGGSGDVVRRPLDNIRGASERGVKRGVEGSRAATAGSLTVGTLRILRLAQDDRAAALV